MCVVQSRLVLDPVTWAVENILLCALADKMAAGDFPAFMRSMAEAQPVIQDIAKHDPHAGAHVREQVRAMWDLNTSYLLECCQ